MPRPELRSTSLMCQVAFVAAIVQAAVKNSWGLYQIAPDQTSLEDVFTQLTHQDAAAAEVTANAAAESTQ